MTRNHIKFCVDQGLFIDQRQKEALLFFTMKIIPT